MSHGSLFRRARGAWAITLLVALAPLLACGWLGSVSTEPTFPPGCDPATPWNPPAGNATLDDVTMSGPGEGWAVGALMSQPMGTGKPTGAIYHLTQGQWRRESKTFPGYELSSISMGSPTDGWVVGVSQQAGAVVAHYTGGQWRTVDIPAVDQIFATPPGTDLAILHQISVRMFGPDAGWMAAWNFLPQKPDDLTNQSKMVILRYQHGVWTPIPTPNVSPTTEMSGFSAVSADEAWLIGSTYNTISSQTGVLAHYTRGAWSLWPQTFPGGGTAITMFSASDGWAFGAGIDTPLQLRFDGARWSPVATPPEWASQHIALGVTVFAIAPGVAWFPSATITQGVTTATVMEQYANGQWRQVAWPYPEVHIAHIVASASGDLWGVGNILHSQQCISGVGAEIQQGVFLHEHQGAWTKAPAP